jgi:hypothetical protein
MHRDWAKTWIHGCNCSAELVRRRIEIRGSIKDFLLYLRWWSRSGVDMSPTIIILLAAWLGLNVAFVALRIYVTSNRRSRDETEAAGYPRLVS